MTSATKILVIDDEPDVVSYLSVFLEDEGFNVVTARDGPDGLAMARLESPDLITLDITMPGMSGIEVLTTLRRDSDLASIPVIVVTGVANFQNLTTFRGVRPPEAFMSKPVDRELLLGNIRKLLKLETSKSSNKEDSIPFSANNASSTPMDFERFFKDSPCVISVQGPDLRIIGANNNFISSFDDPADRYCYQVYKQRDDKCPDCPVEQTFQDGQTHISEQLVTLPDGRKVPILAYTSPVRGPDDKIIAVVEISADITPAKRLQSKLRKSREEFRLLFNEVPCYISVQDRNLHIVQSNRKFKEDFGDREGARCFEIYKHRDEPCVICPVEETFDDGQIHHSEEVVTSMSGERINTLVSTAPILDSEGDIAMVMEMSTNITQIRDLQHQLTNLGMLVGSISHGLKGLLNGLDGGMYMLNTGLDNNKKERVDQGRQMVRRNVEHIRQVVLDLLYIAGEDEPQFEPVELHNLAGTVAKSLKKRAADLGIEFRIDFDDDIETCSVDTKSLKESLLNILSSAFDSCRIDNQEKSHFVHFRLTSDGDNAVFDIEDNGIGMDQETRESMFSLAFTSKGAKGTGLRLFTANKVIEKHRGTIEVKSEPGKGTAYNIRIPRVRDRSY